jgi:hypothetical protein
MTEIDDFDPAPVEPQPALTALTGGQVALYMKAKGAGRPCEACGHDEWEMCPERDAALAELRGLVYAACRQCALMRTFLRKPIMAWLKGARHAD